MIGPAKGKVDSSLATIDRQKYKAASTPPASQFPYQLRFNMTNTFAARLLTAHSQITASGAS